MEITLNTYSKDAYEFAQNYLHSHRDRSSAWTNEPAVSAFDIACQDINMTIKYLTLNPMYLTFSI